MGLPYARTPEYISYSSLTKWERDPLGYYFDKCAPEEYSTRTSYSNPAMRVGSAFDTQVKAALGAPVEHKDHIDEEARELGELAYRGYISSGAFEELPGGVVAEPARHEVARADWKGIPIAGYPDARWENQDSRGVLDWKTSGAYSAERKLPRGDFFKVWNSDGMSIEGCEYPLHEIDSKWAAQLCFYGVLEGFVEDFKACVDQILLEAGSDLVVVARYAGPIVGEFADSVYARCARLWKAIQNHDVIDESKLPTTDLNTLSLMT